jgi:transposase
MIVKLNAFEVKLLNAYKKDGYKSIRQINRANILLLLNKGKKLKDIVDFLDVERTTVWRTGKRYLEEGIQKALEELERPGQPTKYTMEHQAGLVALGL